jgi:hypothetical protein
MKKQVVVFASEGVVRGVALRTMPSGGEPCVVVDYDDRHRRDEDVSPEELEVEKLGVSRDEFDRSATYIF